jgi:hypothetical protein
MTTPRRRRFRYSLRTLFVIVAIFGVWLGWELKHVNARQRAIRQLATYGGACGVSTADWVAERNDPQYIVPSICAVRRALGDRAIYSVELYEDAPFPRTIVSDLQRLFPEASIFDYRQADRLDRGRESMPAVQADPGD